jgi:hypothetical protein
MIIAVLGGTGEQGSGLALRWARAGHQVILGSRMAEKAERVAQELCERLGGQVHVTGADNPSAAAVADVVVLSVPYSSQLSILNSVRDQLVGKLLISVVVPLRPPKVSHAWRPEAGSAAMEAQSFLGADIPVVVAFQNISSAHVADPAHEVESDVLICGDKSEHKAVAGRLAADAGMRAVDAGPLANASVVEGLTAVLIGINIRHRVAGAGIRITGLSG